MSESDAADLKEAFSIDTVRELAGNQYLCIAQGINSFSKATGEILDKSFKSEEYEELRNRSMNYPHAGNYNSITEERG